MFLPKLHYTFLYSKGRIKKFSPYGGHPHTEMRRQWIARQHRGRACHTNCDVHTTRLTSPHLDCLFWDLPRGWIYVFASKKCPLIIYPSYVSFLCVRDLFLGCTRRDLQPPQLMLSCHADHFCGTRIRLWPRGCHRVFVCVTIRTNEHLLPFLFALR